MKTEYLTQAEDLELKIAQCSGDQRLALQPKLSETIQKMSENGETIPRRLARLEASLSDEAVEAQFDNMPI